MNQLSMFVAALWNAFNKQDPGPAKEILEKMEKEGARADPAEVKKSIEFLKKKGIDIDSIFGKENDHGKTL